MNSFSLEQHHLTVGEVHHNLPPSSLVRARHQVRKGREHRGKRCARRLFGSQDGTVTERQARRQAPGLRERRLVGAGEHTVRGADLRHQPATRARLPEYPRPAVLLRWVRRLGPEVPHQGARDLFAAVPCAVHAHDADSSDTGGTRLVRAARLHDLQRGRISGQPPDQRPGLHDEHRPEPRRRRTGHSRDRVRRRDEERASSPSPTTSHPGAASCPCTARRPPIGRRVVLRCCSA